VLLPNAGQAIIDPRKITDYLLSSSHPEGRTKARFFGAHGFSIDRPAQLAAALARHAVENSVRLSRRNTFGTIYTVSGPLPAPDGRIPMVDSVWIIELEAEVPRLITAYPN
jgi:hypothetical protein